MSKLQDLTEPLAPKVALLFQAIYDLLEENVDLNTVKVSEIATKAGIGKGTIYEYFETKEDLIALAFIWMLKKTVQETIETLEQYDSVKDMLGMLFGNLGARVNGRECIIFIMVILFDSSPLNATIRKYMELLSYEERPVAVLRYLISKAKEKGQRQGKCGDDLLQLEISSKFMTYALWLSNHKTASEKEKQETQAYMIERIWEQF